MGSLNKVQLIGNCGKDPEVRYTQTGQAVVNFSLATNESWKGKDGQQQERTEWHKLVAWGKTAELCGEYVHKGKQLYVEGNLQTREWQDKDGHKNYTTEIVIDKLVFLGSAKDEGGGERRVRDESQRPQEQQRPASGGGGPPEEDIPF